MGAIRFVTLRRLTRQWRSLVAAGILLGLAFGVSLASFANARRTSSAYERVLADAEAPDASVALGARPEPGVGDLASIDGVTGQRVYAGFLGRADGIEPFLTTALIAPVHDRFPIELPQLQAGRMPDPDAPDEVIVNTDTATRGGLEVGQRLHFRLFDPASSTTKEADVEIVGIGTFPVEMVADETLVLGAFFFTRAFYEAHRDVVVYAASNVDLAPGIDARRDLAPALREVGYELQSARTQERATVRDALRPLLIVLLAIGVLAFGAAVVATSQVVVRTRDRWQHDDDRLRTLGIARRQILAVEVATGGLVAAVALVTAIATTALASPLAPIGPLHEHDPAAGFFLDGAVVGVGSLVLVSTILLLTVALSSVRNRALRPAIQRSPWVADLPGSPATVAGLTLALRTDDGRRRGWRAVVATTAAAMGVAFSAAFVVSAVALSETPANYGFDADLIALNAYGDQFEDQLERAFGDRDDVLAATAYTTGSYLLDGRAVPGLAATSIKGDLSPTILRGRAPRADDEIMVGRDTLELIGADFGETIRVQLLATADVESRTTGQPVRMRIVGVAAFPAVNQVGTDMPRLGVGAMVSRDAYLRMRGEPDNQPEFTMVRLSAGADPDTVIDANADGFQDAGQSATTWFTDTKPAELRQLDAAGAYLRGALIVGYAILLGVFVHALWIRVRANRRDLAVLRVVGCTRRQLDAITAWQTAPFAIGAIVVGIPIGLAVGRYTFRAFARSLAVVEQASIPALLVAALVVGTLLAGCVAAIVGVVAARRIGTATTLREM